MHRNWTLWVALLCLAACAPPAATVAPPQTPAPSPEITLFHTPTASALPTQVVATATPTLIPSLTPTPLTYRIVKNDDMAGIALRYGVPLPALMTANPKVNPHFLSIGAVLVIPPGPAGTARPEHTLVPSATTTPATPTPVGNAAPAAPTCYQAGDQSVWCFVLVRNSGSQAIEALSAQVLLASNATQAPVATQTATAPIDLLPAGQAMPLVAHFPAPAQPPFGANATLTSAFFIPEGDQRYLPVKVDRQDTSLSPDASSARVRGQVSLPDGHPPAQTLWVLAVAYDAGGQVAGLRKWIAAQPLAAGGAMPFDLSLYSLGPPIQHVEILVEARP